MTAALALLLGAFAAGWLAPALLTRADLTRTEPAALLTAWLLSAAGVLATTVSGIALLLFPGHGNGTSMATAIHGCLEAISHGTSPRSEEFAGLVGLLLVSGLIGRFAVTGTRMVRRRARIRREHLSLLRVTARCAGSSPATWWLDHDEPMAFSLADGAGVIVATEGLSRHLSATEVAAVLAHEQAHLRGHHHFLITWVDALGQALPFVPLFRRAPAAVRELVELAADVAAVRACGTHTVRTALVGVARHSAPDGTLGMAQGNIDLRLARLESGKAPAGRLRRTLSCGFAAAAVTALPALTGSAVLVAIAVVTCPLSGG